MRKTESPKENDPAYRKDKRLRFTDGAAEFISMDAFLRDMAEGPRKIAVVGHFGTGKTEFAVSLAFALAAEGISPLALADLDIENPYFRSREQGENLERAGVKVYSDAYGGRSATELQTLDPAIRAPLEDETCRVICDLGGDPEGARLLNQYTRYFRENARLLYVVNKNRPGTDTVPKALGQLRGIEAMIGLPVTGLVSNTHLLRLTEKRDILEGWDFASALGRETGLPVLCACCPRELLESLAGSGLPLFPIGLYMRPTYLDKKL